MYISNCDSNGWPKCWRASWPNLKWTCYWKIKFYMNSSMNNINGAYSLINDWDFVDVMCKIENGHLRQMIDSFLLLLLIILYHLSIANRMIEQYYTSLDVELTNDPKALLVMCPICEIAELKWNNHLLSCSCGFQWVFQFHFSFILSFRLWISSINPC